MGYLNDFLNHVAESFSTLFHLDPDPDLHERANVEKVIDQTATVAAIVSIVMPIPTSEFVVMTPLMGKMALHIGRIKGYDVTQERAQEMVAEIVGVLGMTLTAHLLIVTVAKFVPFGGLLTVAMIYASTWAIGNVIDYYFDCLRSGSKPSKDLMKDLFSEQFKVGKDRAEKLDRSWLERKAAELRERFEEVWGDKGTDDPGRPSSEGLGMVAELERLAQLRSEGLLSEKEFKKAKAKLLDS